jgi:hypothetical protein
MLIGDWFSGHDLLCSSLSAHPSLVCHGDLLDKSDKVRRAAHEAYFGASGKVIDWFVPGMLSVEHYLNNKIFDNTLHGEKSVGVELYYDHFLNYDLWDYADQKCRAGDFCFVHVVRNPIACYAAQRLASQELFEESEGSEFPLFLKPPRVESTSVSLDPRLLTEFVQRHLACQQKIDRLCGDRVIVPYHEFILDSQGILERLLSFLELPYSPACIPNIKDKYKLSMLDRISNWSQLKKELPGDVLQHLDDSRIF